MREQEKNEPGAEERDAKNKGNALLSYLLECVRLGSRSKIESALSKPENLNLSEIVIGKKLILAHIVLQYQLPQIVRAGLDGGMSWTIASEMYQNYLKKVQQMRTVSECQELQNTVFLEFADKVALTNYQFSSLVLRCRTYINEHLSEPLSSSKISEALNISKSYLCHIYKSETGETISDYIRQKKISEAKLLLQYSSLSLTAIWEQLGYCSQSHFTDIFHKKTDMTPSQFRNKYRPGI